MNKIPLWLFIAGAIILAGVVFVFLNFERGIKECQEGDLKNCTLGACSGFSYCKEGKWGYCEIPMVCKPGSVVGCYKEGCGAGYKTCNECGTGYYDCVVS